MAANDLQRVAYYDMMLQGIHVTVPKFTKAHVKNASEEEVVVEIPVVEFQPRSNDRINVYLPNLGPVGHIVSRASWRCQEPDRALPVVQQSLVSFNEAEKPNEEDLLFITGKSERLADGKHSLRFLVHTFHGDEKIVIGQGSSLLDVPPIPTVSPVSFGDLAPGTPAASTEPSPPVTSPPPPSSSSASASLAPPPLLPTRKSSLRSAPYSIVPKRRVSFGKNTEQRVYQFMFMNVSTTDPDSFTELKEELRKIGVEARKIIYAALPIEAPNKFVFYFQVYDDDSAKVEQLIEEENWTEVFDPELMATTRKGSMVKAMSMQDIVEAMILSTMVARSTVEEPSGIPLQSTVQELISDKKHLKAAIKRRGVVEHVTEMLSNKGLDVLLRIT